MNKMFSLSLFVFISYQLLKIDNSGKKCTNLKFESVDVGSKHIHDEACNICECKENGFFDCIQHAKCYTLNCLTAVDFERRCCHELNCPNTTNSINIYIKGNVVKNNISNDEHPGVPKSAHHNGRTVIIVICVIIIIILICFIMKSVLPSLKRREPRPRFESYARFDR